MHALIISLLVNIFAESHYTPSATTFTLVAPRHAQPQLIVGGREVDMQWQGADLWQVVCPSVAPGSPYAFRTFGLEGPGPGARCVAANGKQGIVYDPRQTDPEGWESDTIGPLAAKDWMIYELHLRDFTIHPSSGVRPEWRGKYLGLTEPQSLERLKRLGINAVHIMPFFDFASVDELGPADQYNWGYDPAYYNVPEGSYATSVADPLCRIREVKEMVMALHRAGLRVVMDVVYNHVFDLATSAFERTYPGYYFRTIDGAPSNGSGCGNETASEQPFMRQFILESMKYWASEYHIDGFRLDLMGCHDLETLRLLRAELPNTMLYGEGWTAGPCALPEEERALKANMRELPGVAAFGDELRDGMRGPYDRDHIGAFLAGKGGHERTIMQGIKGMIDDWASSPQQMIAYVSCHDDMCLVDRLHASIPSVTLSEVVGLEKLAQTAVFTSQGIPFMLAGEEVLRDKRGVHNSYASPDSVNQIDWSRGDLVPDVATYIAGLAHMRAAHPVFRLGSAEEVARRLSFMEPKKCLVAFRLDGKGLEGESWGETLVVLNGGRKARNINIGAGRWSVVARGGEIDPEGLCVVEGPTVKVPPQSALIIRKLLTPEKRDTNARAKRY